MSDQNMIPATPPLTPIPASVVVYEGLRIVPALLAMVIDGGLMFKGAVGTTEGLLFLMGVIAGQLYPGRAKSATMLGQ